MFHSLPRWTDRHTTIAARLSYQYQKQALWLWFLGRARQKLLKATEEHRDRETLILREKEREEESEVALVYMVSMFVGEWDRRESVKLQAVRLWPCVWEWQLDFDYWSAPRTDPIPKGHSNGQCSTIYQK